MKTISRVEEQMQTESVGPSATDWVDLAIQMGYVGKKADGNMHSVQFSHKLSLDQLAYVNNKSRMFNTGGDSAVEEVARGFYSISNVEEAYYLKNGKEINVYLTLSKEWQGMALDIASVENKLSEKYADYNIELYYFTKDDSYVPTEAIKVSRR